MKLNELMTMATAFRRAIESAIANDDFSNDMFFSNFPVGCCGICSDLLGHYLLLHGIHSKYVCGSYYYDDMEMRFQSHAWVEVDNVIIDITGDQFKGKKEFLFYSTPVYVGEMDDFHRLFDVDENRDIHEMALLTSYDGLCVENQIRQYNTIEKYIK